MIHFSNNRTPLPDNWDVEAALACSSDYWKYHRLILTGISNTLREDEFERLKQKAQTTQITLRKLGLCINAEYLAIVRQKYHERAAKSKRQLVVFLVGLAICAGLSLLLTVQVTSFLAVGLLASYLYWDHIAETNLSKAETRLEDRRLERRHVELDLEAICQNCTGWNAEKLATIKLYLEDPYAEWVHPGQIDLGRRPESQRPIPPATSEGFISGYGANFENPEDPRIPEAPYSLIMVKLMLALLPAELEYEISEAFQDKYSYSPSYLWDYFDFQHDWKNGKIPKLGNRETNG